MLWAILKAQLNNHVHNEGTFSKNSCNLLPVLCAAAFFPCATWISAAEENPPSPHTSDIPGPIRLLLPPIIPASTGLECNVYFRNIVLTLNPGNYAFDVTCAKGKQYSERWAFTPTPEDAGDHPITITVLDDQNKVVARGASIVRVSPDGSGPARSISVLTMGASLTQAAVYPQHLLDLAEKDPALSLKLIGCRGAKNQPADGDLRHEGYNGWTAQAFVTLHGPLSRTGEYKRPDTGSPFVFESANGGHALDFQRYYEQFNGGRAPDFITIHLGPNEIARCSDDNIDEEIDKALGYFDQLIAKIREAGPGTHIGIVLPAPGSPNQDGSHNLSGSRKRTAWQYRRNHHRLMERMTAHFRDRTDENVHIVPANVNMDAENHYPTFTAPRNARSEETVTRFLDGVHPSPEGYRQTGDMIYSWIKSVLAAPPPSQHRSLNPRILPGETF